MTDEFEIGVQRFYAYIAAECEADESEAHHDFQSWKEDNPHNYIDAQVEARRRWSATR